MKYFTILLIMPVICILFSCSGDKKTETEKKTGTDTSSNTPTTGGTSDPGSLTEETVIPVYAVWQPDITKSPYDGLYDSTSHYLRLCQNKEKIHIDDPSKLTIKTDERCYKQGAAFAMIILKKDSLAAPVFLTVLHVDTVAKKIVAVTDNNDTLATSITNMNAKQFDALKKDYRSSTPVKQRDVEKIKKYYAPERKTENQIKKERALKIQPR